MSDPVRLLHRRSEVGYTDVPALALPNEPEAISRADQRRVTEDAQLAARARARAEWWPHRQLLLAMLEDVSAYSWSSRIRDELQTARRSIERIDKRL